MNRRKASRVLFLAFLAALSSACERKAAGRSGSAGAATEGYPREVELGGEVVRLATRPVRILPCNASAVDFLASLVDPARVLALPTTVARFATFERAPDEWSKLPEIPDLETETVLSRDPDLILTHAWQDPSAIETIRRAGIPVVKLPETHAYSDLREVILALGRVLDEVERSRKLVLDCDARVGVLRSDRSRVGLSAMTYSNFGTGGWTAGRNTTVDVVFELAGLTNAATAAGIDGHSRVEIEQLLALDPDFLIVTQPDADRRSDPTLAMLQSDATLGELAAVRQDHIVSLPGRLLLADSHRVVDAAEALVAEIDRLLGESAPSRRRGDARRRARNPAAPDRRRRLGGGR